MVKESGLQWVIPRFGAVLATDVGSNPEMFDMPLDNRVEFVHTRDAALACVNAITCDEAVGKILLIGGGKRCQMTFREMTGRGLEAFGIGRLPEKAFTTEPVYLDWLDTEESQRLLQYQRYGYEEWLDEAKKQLGMLRHLARIFRPVVRWYLIRQSPYC